MPRVKIIANYLPQYHVIPENSKWWGDGFTDWLAVKRTQPLYKGHSQPRIPLNKHYYHLDDVDKIRWQAQLARKYGVYGFGIIGFSLGGVAEKIAISNHQSGDMKDNEGSAVALEVLVASGLIGVIPFLVYFYKTIKSALESLGNDDGIGKGLLLGLVVEILILQLNQNFLRPYFGMHIAVLSVYLRCYREYKNI